MGVCANCGHEAVGDSLAPLATRPRSRRPRQRNGGAQLPRDAYRHHPDVRAVAGRHDEAAEALEQALERYERKKNLAMVAQLQPKLTAFRVESRTQS